MTAARPGRPMRIAALAVLGGVLPYPIVAFAQAPAQAPAQTVVSARPGPVAAGGVSALLKQAAFWKGKNRNDLAIASVRRALAIDPDNARARALLAEYSRPPAPPPSSNTQAMQVPQVGANGQRLGDRAAVQGGAAPVQAGGPVVPQVGGGNPAPAAASDRAADRRTAAIANRARNRTARVVPPRPYVRSATDQAGEYRIQGFAAIEDGKLPYAEDRFRLALKVNANDPDALGGLGIVRMRGGRFDESRQLLERAAKLGATTKWNAALQSAIFYGQLRVAQAARDANNLPQAEAATRALAPADARQDALARALLADIFARQGRYAEALAMYRTVADASSTTGIQSVIDIQTRQTRLAAMQAVSRGDYAGAERIFQQAMVAGSTDPWLRYEYARLLVAQNRVQQADGVIAPLTRVNQPEALYAAALYSQQVGRTGNAGQLLNQIQPQARTPQMNAFATELRATAIVAQARALQAQGRTGEALGLLRQIAGQPLSIAATSTVVDALYEMGDTATAVALATAAARQPVTDPDSYQGVVVVLAKAGQDQVAVPLVSRISAASGQNPYNSRSMARLNALLAAAQADRMRLEGNYAPAFEVLQAAYATAPSDVDILAALGRLYQAGRMFPQAETVYGLVRQQRPNDVGNLMGLGDSAIGAGDLETARDAVDTAMRLAPNQPDVYLLAARVETARGRQSAALRYLRQAREMVGQQQAVAYGPSLSPTNPFMGYQAQAAQAPRPQPINPFALPATGQAQGRQTRSPFSYAPPIHTGAPPAYGAPTLALEG